jgi:hypothetical protein
MDVWSTYITAIWYYLWPLGTFYAHLVYFSCFGILYQEKSGNSGAMEDSFQLPSESFNLLKTSRKKIYSFESNAFQACQTNGRHQKRIFSHTFLFCTSQYGIALLSIAPNRFDNHFIGQKVRLGPELPDFSWCNIPKRGKIYQMTTKYTKWP